MGSFPGFLTAKSAKGAKEGRVLRRDADHSLPLVATREGGTGVTVPGVGESVNRSVEIFFNREGREEREGGMSGIKPDPHQGGVGF